MLRCCICLINSQHRWICVWNLGGRGGRFCWMCWKQLFLELQGSCRIFERRSWSKPKKMWSYLESMGCCQRKSKGSDWSILFLCTTIETASHAYGDSKQHYLDSVGLQQTLVSDSMTCPRFWSRRSTIKEGGGPQQESWKPWIYNTYMTKYDCMIWKRKILCH